MPESVIETPYLVRDLTAQYYEGGMNVLCSDVSQGEMLRVTSDNFRCECWGYAQQLGSYWMQVRLELPDGHPSLQDAMADQPGHSADYYEFMDTVPFASLEHSNGRKVRTWYRPLTSAEHAAIARRQGFERLRLPELDAGLRNPR